MELPSMNAVTPFICSRGSPFLGQNMSDLKIDRIEVRISHRFWSPGEWITRIRSFETWVIFNINVEASLNGRVFFLIFLQDFIFATLQLWDISIKIMSNLMSVSQQNMSFNYECPNVPILHYFWRDLDNTSFCSERDVMGKELSKLHCHVGETLRTRCYSSLCFVHFVWHFPCAHVHLDKILPNSHTHLAFWEVGPKVNFPLLTQKGSKQPF